MFEIVDMTEKFARDISSWKYPGEYSLYSFKDSENEFEQIMNGLHLAAIDRRTAELLGFIAVGWSAQVVCAGSGRIYQDESYTDLALGLRPSVCGCGMGGSLLNSGVSFLKNEFPGDGVRLTVASNNIRAIKLYSKYGFYKSDTFKKYMLCNGKRKLMQFEIFLLD